jgi:two-component system LytT family sensor kinase
MFFDSFFDRYFKNIWLRINIQSIVVALLIGTILNAFFYVLRGALLPQRVFITYVVSYMITMSISNMIALSYQIMSAKFRNKWTEPSLFYLSLVIGMIIGTELTFFFISKVYNKTYTIFTHLDDLKFNLLIALVVGTVVYINNLQKNRYEYELRASDFKLGQLNQLKAKAELQALQSKINPHFLYNALNSITSLIHEQPDLAEEMTIKLSKLFRYSLNTQDSNFASVSEELEVVKLYLDIEKIRFQHKLSIHFDIDNNLLELQIPRFLIQPLVENSIKHGINKLTLDGEIKIKCWKEKEHIMLSIHDNGPAFDATYQAGYGLQSTFDKLNLLYQDKYELQINNGTYKEVLISIPINHEA